NAELQGLRLAAFDHIDRLGHHRAFDAAARDRAQEIALVVDHQIGADRPRRRAPGLDHGRKGHAAPRALPVLGRFEDVFVSCQHRSLHRLIMPDLRVPSLYISEYYATNPTQPLPARFSEQHDCHAPTAPGTTRSSNPSCEWAAVRQRAAASPGCRGPWL